MRLTNVAHLRLPFGRLWGYDVSVSEPVAEFPISFDQRRHVGAGARPGSWMALSFRLRGQIDRDDLAQAWLSVIARHGTLRTVFSPGEDGEPRLHEVQVGPGGWVEHEIGVGQAVNDALRDVLDLACSPYESPSHRLCVLETAVDTTVVVGADHAHVDMWSMLVIVRDLLAALGAVQRGENLVPNSVQPFAAHTRAYAALPAAPEEVRIRWAEILRESGDFMPGFPLPLGSAGAHPERVEVRDVFDVDDTAAFCAQAREEGVSTLALAVSAMTAATREIADSPLRAVFPVHSRYDAEWHDSVGWFITNSVIESQDPHPQAASAAVREAIRLGSWPLEGILQPWGGMPEGPGMFAISWLDLRRLPVHVDSRGLEAQYVGAEIRTDGVMLWFILDESGLHLRCRYPDTPEARAHVGGWLDLLVARLKEGASSSVRGVLRIDNRSFRIERAIRQDVAGIVALLFDDEYGSARESTDITGYEAAFDVLVHDRSHYVAVVRDEAGRTVATMQLTILPGLLRGGATRLQIEGLRVASPMRSQGLGTAMLEWAHAYGLAHGATLAQLATDRVRDRARAFYARLGYESEQVGLKRSL